MGAETKSPFQCSDILKKEYHYKTADFQDIRKCLQNYYHHNDSKSIAEIVLKIKPSLEPDSYEMGVITAYEAWLYLYVRNSAEAEKFIDKAQKISDNLKDEHQKTTLQLKISIFRNNILELKGEKSEVIVANTKKIFDLASTLSPQSFEYHYYRARLANTLAMCYLIEKNKTEADKYVKITEVETNSLSEPFLQTRLYKLYGFQAMQEKNYDLALQNYLQAVKIAKEKDIPSEIFYINPMISAVYQEKKDYKTATLYSSDFKRMSDSIANVKLKMVEFLEKNNFNKADEEKESTSKMIFVVIPVMLLGVFYLLYYFRKKEKKLKIEVQERTTSTDEIKNLTQLAKENEEAFYVKFPEVYPELYQKLNTFEPPLSSSEVKFCMYMKMKFPTKDIAIFTNSTPKSVENRKYRLRKKLNITQEQDIYHAIDQI